ncbi:MAG: peptidoglycan DD-metalloendopeptidase family protein [Desulfobacterium sp.]|nr:peptidoglycan DD-metalloendopeptidase family protein [Desulfobacterium sp.]MBU3949378.1 peptidoglycan DD-metalloendopeptidase family protein [Pseudomonadota bacterium]MBU4036183.1 peptidoglycan DD-metalloendopeptidase family protein [Pseudomonadota bacterium]
MFFSKISVFKTSVLCAILLIFVAGADGGSAPGNTGDIRNKDVKLNISKSAADKTSLKNTKTKQYLGIGKLQQRAKLIDSRIEQSKVEIESIRKKESLVLNSLNEQDIAIDNIRKNISSLRDELEAANSQIIKINEKIKTLDNEIQESERYVAKRLVALYKLNQIGSMNVLASVDSIYEIIQRKMYFERILASDKIEMDKLSENRNRLNQLQINLNEKKAKQKLGEKSLEEQVEKISFERQKRAEFLGEIRSKKSLEIAAVKSLEEAAKQLDDAIKSFAAKNGGTNFLQKDFFKDPESFKGLLDLPVKGKIISNFGTYHDPKYNIVNFRSGIDIKAEIGEPIRSVIPGKIIYSGWFKGYGNMIIIDHGKSYYTVYAHLEESFKSKGDMVEADEVIASTGDTGLFFGTGVYFEIRHHGKPIDPIDWFKK